MKIDIEDQFSIFFLVLVVFLIVGVGICFAADLPVPPRRDAHKYSVPPKFDPNFVRPIGQAIGSSLPVPNEGQFGNFINTEKK